MYNNYYIEEFDPLSASDELWDMYFDYNDKLFEELNPGDPIPPRSLYKKFLTYPHPHYKSIRYNMFPKNDRSLIIGRGIINITLEDAPAYETNKQTNM